MNNELKEMIKQNKLPKCYFTKEQMSKMRAIDLSSFISWYDNSMLIKERGNYRLSNNTSVVINGIWARDFKTDKSYTAIDFCNKFLGLNMYASLYVLNEYLKQNIFVPANINHLMPTDIFNQRLNNGTYIRADGIKQIYAYLCKTRHISRNVVKKFIDDDYIYAECLPKGYNLLFSIFNEKNKICGFERTGILSNSENRYKGCIITKEYSGFSYQYKYIPNTQNILLIFESAIDLMSVLSLEEMGKVILSDKQSSLLISLRGIQGKVLENLASNYSDMIFCTDCDIAGISFYKQEADKYSGALPMYYTLNKYGVKDWNELLFNAEKIETPILLNGNFLSL